MDTIEIAHSFDEKGYEIVTVPLSNSKHTVKLYAADLNEIIGLGVTFPWLYKQSQVIFRSDGRSVSIARMIVDADIGQVVSFLDGDVCNLTRPNLVRVPGNSKYRARGLIREAFKRSQPEVTHIQWQFETPII
jgi:hypothetical protein